MAAKAFDNSISLHLAEARLNSITEGELPSREVAEAGFSNPNRVSQVEAPGLEVNSLPSNGFRSPAQHHADQFHKLNDASLAHLQGRGDSLVSVSYDPKSQNPRPTVLRVFDHALAGEKK